MSIFCNQCGTECIQWASFCKECGNNLNEQRQETYVESSKQDISAAATLNTNPDSDSESYENKMLAAYIGKPDKVLWYQNAFSSYNLNGMDKFTLNWSWWAFFGGWIFLLYRKAYLAALVFFVLELPSLLYFYSSSDYSIVLYSVLWLAPAIASGGTGAFLVYTNYKKAKSRIEERIKDNQTRYETMKEIGGVHYFALWLIIPLYLIFTTVIDIVVNPQKYTEVSKDHATITNKIKN